ncbi:glycosyl hydrolase family 25 [Bifidobacterium sp. 82T24]|uniref:glycoside hydrolase family 25 protein n=1 Tax=Bifidobacterium pluvialisilvae TaxID=2834436 RepID=UPI001F3EA253|nr:glycosyl hydrolase family 25 [Bifidobacterium pluvialisilvae]
MANAEVLNATDQGSPISDYAVTAAADETQLQAQGEGTTVASQDAVPENPSVALPDKVSAEISDDDVMTAPKYASTTDGELKNVETGETVTDPNLVGTADAPADPLAKTDGKSFIPVPMDEVKDQMEEAGKTVEQPSGNSDSDSNAGSDNAQSGDDTAQDKSQSDSNDQSTEDEGESVEGQTGTSSYVDSTTPTVRTAKLPNNEYGAHWGTYNGTPAFFDYKNNLFAQQAKGVIDVSEHNGNIDWAKAKAAGVEGAIIRIGYGTAALDAKALRNISECKRLKIPFGIYLYSYAYDNTFASHEATNIVNQLKKAGVSPNTLSYPVYYDLEDWTWTGHQHPTSPKVYEGIVNSWYATMRSAGYTNLAVYSYVYYLNTALNSSSIHAKTQWVASYGARNTFNFSMNYRGWQYSAGGRINGVPGDVDMSAFGNHTVTVPAAVPNAIYRLYLGGVRIHHYTSSYNEMRTLVLRGWQYEGVLGIAASDKKGQPVHRLYNGRIKQHHFTGSVHERDVLKTRGWRYEGIAWYSSTSRNKPIYRLYNGHNKEHFYTSNAKEYELRGSQGWSKEGISWYGA